MGYFAASYFDPDHFEGDDVLSFGLLAMGDDYFDCDYFDPTYFDTPECGGGEVTEGHAPRFLGTLRRPSDEADELLALI